MLKDLLPKIRAFLIGSVILAVASGVAVVAAGYGVYAVLRLQFEAPAAAGITAVVFAVVAAITALVLRGIFSSKGSKGKQSKAAPARNPEAMAMGMEAGAAVIGLLTDLLASRRTSAGRQSSRDKRRSRR